MHFVLWLATVVTGFTVYYKLQVNLYPSWLAKVYEKDVLPYPELVPDRQQFRYWVCTMTQSSITTLLTFYSLVFEAPNSLTFSLSAIPVGKVAICLLLGHAIFDMFWWLRMTVFRKPPPATHSGAALYQEYELDWSLVFHHVIMLISMPVLAYNEKCLLYMLFQMLREGSSPCISLRVLLFIAKKFKSPWNHLNNVYILPVALVFFHDIIDIYTLYRMFFLDADQFLNSSLVPTAIMLLSATTVILLTILSLIWTYVFIQRQIESIKEAASRPKIQ
jgi:hypothetical protein